MRFHETLCSIMALLVALAASATPPAAAATAAAPGAASSGVTVVVARGEPAFIASEKLRIALVNVDDSRCPANARCVWSGHAKVTLSVTHAGRRRTVVIGTPAPAQMHLPEDADLGAYHFSLVSLTPDPAEGDGQAAKHYRATVKVTRRAR